MLKLPRCEKPWATWEDRWHSHKHTWRSSNLCQIHIWIVTSTNWQPALTQQYANCALKHPPHPQTPHTTPISRCETRPPTMSGSKFLPEKYVLKHLYSLSSVICQLWVTAGMPRSKNQKCVVIRKYISWFCEFLILHWSNRQQQSFDFHFAHFADWLKYLPSFLFGFLSWIWQTLRFLIWI